jgi:hypothetical protein
MNVTSPPDGSVIYQCDYWWRGFKCSHLSWLATCRQHGKALRAVGTVSVLAIRRAGDPE